MRKTLQVISKTIQLRHCERSEAISQGINLRKRAETLRGFVAKNREASSQ